MVGRAQFASWVARLAGAFLLPLVACGQAVPVDGEARSEPLIGGRAVGGAEYPSVVAILTPTTTQVECTAAKVGPRHFLLAAHCVYNRPSKIIYLRFQPAATLYFSTSRNLNDSPVIRTATVVATRMRADWGANCQTDTCEPAEAWPHIPDLAVIEIDRDTPDIPTATVDASPVEVGDPVVVLGYGCQQSVQSPNADAGLLKLQLERTVAADTLAPTWTPGDAGSVMANYVLTPGHELDQSAASLCPGDSGGPLFREGDGAWVTGINAFYSFPDHPGTVSATNWHTRLDKGSYAPVVSDLQSWGVQVQGSVPSAKPYAGLPHAIPGTLQAEEYDLGGLGVGYSDTDAVNYPKGLLRSGGVDLDVTSDDASGYTVAVVHAGEWLAFTSNIAADGYYDVEARTAAMLDAALHIEVDGQDVSGPIAIPSTGDYLRYQSVQKNGIRLSSGVHAVHVVFDGSNLALNWVRFSAHVCATPTDATCAGGAGGTAGSSNGGSPGQAGAASAGLGGGGLSAVGQGGGMSTGGAGGMAVNVGGSAAGNPSVPVGGAATKSPASPSPPGASGCSCTVVGQRSAHEQIALLLTLGAIACARRRRS